MKRIQAGGIFNMKAAVTVLRMVSRVLFGMALACIFCLAGDDAARSAEAAGATITVSSKNSTVVEGDTVYVVIKVSSSEAIKGFDGYFTYDSKVLQFVTGGSVVHGNDDKFQIKDNERSGSAYQITYSVKFLARSEGDTSISLCKPYHVYADDDDSSQMSVFYRALNIVVKEQGENAAEPTADANATKTPKADPSAGPAESDEPAGETERPIGSALPSPGKNDVPGSSKLRRLSINGVEFAPDFSPKIKKYSALVVTDEKELDVDYKAKDSRASVTVRGNKNLVEGKNTIKVIVNGTTGERTVYRISLNVQHTDDVEQSAHVTVSKKNGKYFLTGDMEVEVLTIPDEDMIPQGFQEVETTIDGKGITSYALEGSEESSFVLIYGKGNKEELYLYDKEENMLMPYEKVKAWYRSMNGQSVSAVTDEERMIQSLKYVIGIMGAFCGLMLLIAIGAAIHAHRR